MKKFTLFINGRDVDTGVYEYYPYADQAILDFAQVRKSIKALKEGGDPAQAKESIFGRYCVGSDEHNRQAIDAAHKAFGVFRTLPLTTRREILLDCYKLLLKKKEEFINILIVEGHPRKLAEWEFEGMRMGSCPETLNFYCGHIQQEIGRVDREILYLTRKPDGVICMTTPANASASDSYNAILALLTGNTLVVRPSLSAPLSTIFLWKEVVCEALNRHKCPPGTVNIIVTNPKKAMDEWIANPKVSDIIFFGDSKRGLEIGADIFKAGKKPILELSGNDILMVWKDADLEKAAASLLDCFMGSTQICMVPKIALVHHDVYSEFFRIVHEKTVRIKAGLPSDPSTCLAPVGKMREFSEFLQDAIAHGAKLIYGSERVNHRNELDPDGLYVRPALIQVNDVKSALQMRCVKEEIFFPLLPLIKVAGSDEEAFRRMTDFVNDHSFGIRTSLWISSARYLRKFAKQLDNCGTLRINSRHIAFSPYLSTHGGTRRSGGPFGEMNYFWQKTSHLQGVSRTIRS